MKIKLRQRILCGIWAVLFTANTVLSQPGFAFAMESGASDVVQEETDGESVTNVIDEDKPMTIAELAKYDDIHHQIIRTAPVHVS